MKILLVNDVAAPVGGAEILTYDLRDELRRRGHDARVFASDSHGPGSRDPDYLCFGTTGELRTLNRVANPRAYVALKRVLDDFDPDVVHVRMFTTQMSPLILPILKDRPAIYHAAWYETICPTGLKMFPDGERCDVPAGPACRRCLSRRAWVALMAQHRMIGRWIHDVFDAIVANSDTTRDKLRKFGVEATHRIYNGVPSRPPRPPLTDPPVIAYSGRLSREKGVEVLVAAFEQVAAEVPEARLLLVGDGPLRGWIEARLQSNGFADRVTMTGHLSRSEAERAMNVAWIQVAPSLLEEPFGNAAAEAMMRGTAIVASAGGGLGEIVHTGGGGLLVTPDEARDLSEPLARFARNRDAVERLGETGRCWAEANLSVERCGQLFEDLYEESKVRSSQACGDTDSDTPDRGTDRESSSSPRP